MRTVSLSATNSRASASTPPTAPQELLAEAIPRAVTEGNESALRVFLDIVLSEPQAGSFGWLRHAWLTGLVLRGDQAGCLRALFDHGAVHPPEDAPQSGLQRLAAAAKEGAVACMEEFWRRGADPAEVPRPSEIPAPAALQHLFGSGLSAFVSPANSSVPANTPLVEACRRGHARAVEWLLAHGAPANEGAALLAACSAGAPECVSALLRAGCGTEARASDGATALGTACSVHAVGGGACAAVLLDHGADASAPGDAFGYSPLHLAATNSMFGLRRRELGTAHDGVPSEAQTECFAALDALIFRLAAALPMTVRGQPAAEAETALQAALFDAIGIGRVGAVRALCALGADARTAARVNDGGIRRTTALHSMNKFLLSEPRVIPVKAQRYLEIVDELIERGADVLAVNDASETALLRAIERMRRYGPAATEATARAVAAQLARWPPHAPLPWAEVFGRSEGAAYATALEHARRRLEVLRGGRDDLQRQQALIAAFLRRLREACGGAVAPAHAPFASFRFVEAGGLERAWAWERAVHRFPCERVAVAKAKLQVASDAEIAAALRCVPLLCELAQQQQLSAIDPSGGAGSDNLPTRNREAEKLLYATARAVCRWGEIRAAVISAQRAIAAAEAALGAAMEEAGAAVERLEAAMQQAQGGVAAAGGAELVGDDDDDDDDFDEDDGEEDEWVTDDGEEDDEDED